MTSQTILITGANGEIGHGLISHLAAQGEVRIIALDLHMLEESLRHKCFRAIAGDITNHLLLQSLTATYDFDTIYHLAALLSTKSEREPALAHRVNVEGTLNVLELAVSQARQQGRNIKVIYPSSIAVYGFPTLEAKLAAQKVKEDDWCEPRTMYGINKLYCERLGRYYEYFYRQLDMLEVQGRVDFRGLRFPGLISAQTVPTGGTSDFAPEMLHAAAQGHAYKCFVRADARIPFMAMPDGVAALIHLEAAPMKALSRQVYNVGAFNPSAGEVCERVKSAFPAAQITFEPDLKRQGIVDSWPADVDDTAARADWGWQPTYDLERAFNEYLLPAVKQRYTKA
jgi:nucleoside-diphosphate-sugar epimerase